MWLVQEKRFLLSILRQLENMVLPMLIVGVILLAIVVYICLRILKNVVIGILLIAVVFFASFMIFGSFPTLRDIPVIGQFLPATPSSPGEAIIVLRDLLYHLDIVGYSRDAQGNLLVAVINTGKAPLTNLTVYVDDSMVGILNSVKQTLASREAEIVQTDFKGPFSSILAATNEANSTFSV
jgi:hypothetical protein